MNLRRAEHPGAVAVERVALHLRADENGTELDRASSPAGRDTRPAARLRGVRVAGRTTRAPRAPARLARRASARRARSTPATSIAPDVIVPVLSRQITSTRASTSIAGSSCTSVRRRARRTTPTANATLVSRTSPSGTIPTTPPTGRDEPVADARRDVVELADEQRDPGRDEHVRDERDDAVDRRAQVAVDERELARLLGQLRRVGVGADLGDPRPRRRRRRRSCPTSSSSPGCFTTGSASPVSSDSSISRFVAVEHLESATTC